MSTSDTSITDVRLDHHGEPVPDHYKWIALSNTTLGVLIATINASILLISLPDIFKGIDINPLLPSNTNYLLWLLLGFLVVTAVLVVSLGRLGDIYGRARTFNLGFAVFTVFSILLSVTWMKGSSGALWLIIMRALQGVGGAMLFANSSAIITDAFPANQRGLALGINGVAAVAGSSIGLVLGGVLAPVAWRAVFLVSVPEGVLGTVWGFAKLRDLSERKHAKMDWWGNITFAIGLVAIMVGITYGIQPYGSHVMGWTSPKVIAEIGGGIVILIAFCVIETRVESPMFHLDLFKVRAFAAGNLASLLSAIGRGGLQFVLIIWLQGIYLRATATASPRRHCGPASSCSRSSRGCSSPDRSPARCRTAWGRVPSRSSGCCSPRARSCSCGRCPSTSPIRCSPPRSSSTAWAWASSSRPTAPRS